MNIIRKLRKELGLTQVQLAEKVGTTQPQIKRLELSERKLTKEWAEKLALHLGVKPSDLLFPNEGRASHSIGMIPVIGRVAASAWMSVEDMDFGFDDIEYVPCTTEYPIHFQFALKVDGNCLNKIARNGDQLICLDVIKSGVNVEPNDLVIVERSRFNGQMVERTAKRIRQTTNGFELWPESTEPNHQEPIKVNGVADGEEIRIIGKVLWILRKP
ncbi:putative prophage repressor [Bartonella australis AUST/NH1]|uniref:Putative prophage repressor n=1 Tax=Bartonella australis (strain Aust/NH1) TaxID=1094489 RepID=M1PBV6_BARAA|nr:LexA family transcriptional regulator [Bartonella australis]AGF74116.1 putative prophage repressor [Bartonella australis AUST/NH1]